MSKDVFLFFYKLHLERAFFFLLYKWNFDKRGKERETKGEREEKRERKRIGKETTLLSFPNVTFIFKANIVDLHKL